MFGWLTQLTHYSCEFTSPWLCWFRLLFLQYLEEAPKMAPANFITFSLRIHAQGFLGYQDGVVSNLWTAKSYCSSSFAHVHGHKMEVNLPCWSCWDRTKKNFFRLAIMGYNGIYWDMGYNGTSTIIFYPCLSHYIPVKNVLCLLVEFLQNRLRGHAYARRTARSSAADARFCRRNKMGISPKVER